MKRLPKSKKLTDEYRKIVKPLITGRHMLERTTFLEHYYGLGSEGSKKFREARWEVCRSLCEAHSKIDDLYREKIGQWVMDDIKNGELK